MIFKPYIIHCSSVDSTNEEAWRMIRNGRAFHGLVIRTDYQTRGKGQSGVSWESEKGKNLLFSVILRPEMVLPSEQFLLTKFISLAVRDFIEQMISVNRVKIKWPNDIYVGNGKIAGILIENSILGNQIDFCVAGIGINMNQNTFLSDAPNPVSCRQLTRRNYDLDIAMDNLLYHFEKWLDILINRQHHLIDNEYLNYLLGYGEVLVFRDKEGCFEAIIQGVTPFGKLILNDNSRLREYDMKEVAFEPGSY